jgi:bifunctional UDP-N-acetylglucosamine pyrophosphorylase / glucosamine-1-phosphate N-acetyltransferase
VSASRPAAVIVLAAGEGTRMKSRTPKVLHTLCGRSLLGHVLDAAGALDPGRLLVVVGHGREQVTAHLDEAYPKATTAVQEQQNGTGHAVRMAVEALDREGAPLEGTVVLAYGDTPLLTDRTLGDLVAAHEQAGNAVTVLSAELDDPHGYGRILRDASGTFTGIVEQADATDAQRAVTEINSGMYAFDGALLREVVGRLSSDNAKGEEYITDAVGILRGDGRRVGATPPPDPPPVDGGEAPLQLGLL